jgi:hypothetical protein
MTLPTGSAPGGRVSHADGRPICRPAGATAEPVTILETINTMQQNKIHHFDYWFNWHGHWIFPNREAAWQCYITRGIDGLEDW